MSDVIFIDGGIYSPVDRNRRIEVGQYLRLLNGKLFFFKSLDEPQTKFLPVDPDTALPEGAVIVELEVYDRDN